MSLCHIYNEPPFGVYPTHIIYYIITFYQNLIEYIVPCYGNSNYKIKSGKQYDILNVMLYIAGEKTKNKIKLST